MRVRLVLAAFLLAAFAASAWAGPPFAYVTNQTSNTVSVVDVNTFTVVATVPVGDHPWGVAINPEGNRVYVTNLGSNSISVIETTTNTVIDTFPLPANSGPKGLAINANGTRLYAAADGITSEKVYVIDAHTGTVITQIDTGTFSTYGIAYNAATHRVYASEVDGDAVLVINTNTDPNVIEATITVGHAPLGVAISQDGNSVYVANSGDDTLSVIDANPTSPTFNQVIATPATSAQEPQDIAVLPVSGTILVAHVNAGIVARLDPTTFANTPYTFTASSLGAQGIAESADGTILVTRNGNTLTKVTPPPPTESTISVGNFPFVVKIGPSTILYTPSAPGNVHASINPGETSATITFDAPTLDGGFPITGYKVISVPDNIVVTTGPAVAPVVVSGLTISTLGTHYTFRVFAHNLNGDGAVGTSNDITAQTAVPGAPTSVSAMAGNGQATVSFSAPADHGAAITSYTVTSSPGGILATGASSPITVMGLTNGTQYTFTVTATNSVGTGPPSSASTGVVPSTVPGAPTGVTATPGNGSVSVAFTAPDNGGAAITSYTVTSSVGGFTASGAASPIVVGGLVNANFYEFSVTATNSAGTGPASALSNIVRPFAPPGAPTDVTAVVNGIGSVRLTCTEPAVTGTGGIISYQATSSPGAISATGNCPFSVTGLTVGVSYTFTMVANNGFSSGAASAPSNAIIAATVPGAPTGLTATVVNDTTAFVSFTPPASDGGSPITLYTVRSTPPAGAPVSILSTQIAISGLTKGTPYTFTVSAINLAGEGPQSAASGSVTPITLPVTDVRAMGGDGRATVTFVLPGTVSASPVTSLVATSFPGGLTGTGASFPLRVNGLTNGTPYTFTVTTNHADGSSETSQPSNAVTPAALPPRTSPWAYVPSAIDSLVAVIDTSTRRVINTIDVGPFPIGVAANAAGTRVYVANADSVSVIDTAAQAVIATLPMDTVTPFAIAVDPAGTHVYVTGEFDQSMVVIDTASNVVTDTISLPGSPIGIDVDPSGASVYAGIFETAQVVRIDTASKSVVAASVPLGTTPTSIAAGPGGLVYAMGGEQGQLITLSGTTLQTITGPSGGGAGGVAIDPADGRVYFSIQFPDSSGALNRVGGGSVTVGASPLGVSVTPTGGQVYVANLEGNSVSVVDGATMTVVATIPVGNAPFSLGRFIAAATESPPPIVADLSITQSASPNPATTNQDVTFTLTIANNGPDNATGVTVTSTVPGGTTFVSASAGCANASGAITCAVGSLASGAGATLQVTVHPTGAGTITHTASVNDPQGDPNGANNTTSLSVTVSAPPPPPLPSELLGVSTRMQVLTGDNVIIGGFIIGGSAPKTVIVRARGPSTGVVGALANPTLTLVPANGDPATTNDDWGDAPNAAQIAASGFAPGDARESAIMLALNPGAYTAIVSGAGGSIGVAIVEIFEIDHPEVPLTAISTRGRVQTGDNVMIGGFIIPGDIPRAVVVRARGPSLASSGVADALANPTLTLVPANGDPATTNDDWGTAANAAELTASGFAPSDPRESALLITLAPGAYTAIVSGVNGATGVAIVEVFAQ